MEKGRIFISYRRADSAGYTGRVYDRLVAHFGKEAIFMDVDTIEAGLDFVEVLENAVQSCDVLVALIGKQWVNIQDSAGNRRLEDPNDFVRIEVATALNRDIRVIPVLVDGAPMPSPAQLPDVLDSLSRRNAVQLNHYSFHSDADRLIEQLEIALNASSAAGAVPTSAPKEAPKKEIAPPVSRPKAEVVKPKAVAGMLAPASQSILLITLAWVLGYGIPPVLSFYSHLFEGNSAFSVLLEGSYIVGSLLAGLAAGLILQKMEKVPYTTGQLALITLASVIASYFSVVNGLVLGGVIVGTLKSNGYFSKSFMPMVWIVVAWTVGLVIAYAFFTDLGLLPLFTSAVGGVIAAATTVFIIRAD